MTKASPNRALEHLIDSNQLTIQIEGYVERSLTGAGTGTMNFMEMMRQGEIDKQ